MELGQYEMRRLERLRQPLSVVYADIDNFKEINDTYGHETGDEMLKIVARVIQGNIRSVDTAARLGGDEFAILLPSAGYEETNEAVQRIWARLKATVGEKGWNAGFSIGAVTCTTSACSLDRIVKVADELMYEVKRSGKNNYRHVLLQGDGSRQHKKEEEEEVVRK